MADQVARFTLADIAQRLGGELVGDGSIGIEQIATLAHAQPRHLSFLTNPKYRAQLADTNAGAVVLHPRDRDATDRPRILSSNPYAYIARALALLNPASRTAELGIHPTAVVHATARIASGVAIGPQAVVGAEARIDSGCQIGPGCSIGDRAEIGADTVLHANVTIYHGCIVGARAIIHSGAVIGADGFGFAPDAGAWLKIPQIGRVVIGDDVEIGANTTIDRGALDDTVIESGVKLDNQIQIAHNVRVGKHTVMAACVGIAGSTTIGEHCMVGGAAGIIGHLSIANNTTVSVGTFVTKSITEPGTYTAVLSAEPHRDWLRVNARMRHLDDMAERIRALEQKLQELERNKP